MKTFNNNFIALALKISIPAVLLSLASISAQAVECKDSVVLVHGNAGTPANWDNTYSKLIDNGYYADEIHTPSWGSQYCPSCNNHSGSEEYPVSDAIEEAIASSCTGKIDVIGHSMGVTLAAQQIIKLDVADKVDTFVGIAGAMKGLWSCGMYPYNVWSSTCGYYGLSVNSPLLNSLENKTIADKVYSIKSNMDEIVCGTGVCLVYGEHTSQIDGEIESITYPLGHFGLQMFTAEKQVELILTEPVVQAEPVEQASSTQAEEEETSSFYWWW